MEVAENYFGSLEVNNRLMNLNKHLGFLRYFSNTAWLVLEKIVRGIVSLLVGVWVARYLGPENFGKLSYAQSYVYLFSAIASVGLDGVVVRHLVIKKVPGQKVLYTALIMKLFGGLLSVLLLMLAAINYGSDEESTILIFVVSLSFLFQSLGVIDFYYQSKVLSKYVVIANLISVMVSAGVKIFLVVTGATLVCFAWVLVLDSAVLAIALVYFYLKDDKKSFEVGSFDYGFALKLFIDSWPIMLSGTVIALYMRIDQILLNVLLGSQAVGVYSAAVRLVEVWFFIPMVLSSSLFPALIGAKEFGEEKFQKRVIYLYSIMIYLAVSIALVMTFFGDWLILTLYGAEFSEASQVLVVQSWAAVFVFIGVAHSKYLLCEDRQSELLYRSVFGVVIAFVSNLLLIPMLGVVGASYSFLLSQLGANFIYDFCTPKARSVAILKIKALLPI